ncbi:hypothetical protein VTL71DRAFT_4944 [Oculimacula yallundae]|uniref:Uncharacterized protein n=1 Tax=Oculimacula yallundae TaxID=86028 RepID=A0ABR4C462_9HELO
MEAQHHTSGFSTLALSSRVDTELGNFDSPDGIAIHIHKRPWPFEHEEGLGATRRSPSPSTRDSKETMQLLGSYFSILNMQAQLILNDGMPYYSDVPCHAHNPYTVFEVTLVGDFFELSYGGHKVARMNKNFCVQFRHLPHFGVQFQAYLPENDWHSVLSRHYATSATKVFAVDVNVYSFQYHAFQVGDILSQASLFLQKPTYDSRESVYCNPQTLEFKGLEARPEAAFISITKASLAASHMDIAMDLEPPEPDRQINSSDLVDSVLNSLSHNGTLREIDTDQRRIKTFLLPHQKKAIDFMSQREGNQVPDTLSLWTELEDVNEDKYFRHTITGARRPYREEARGGIIADDMGLGKTLVVLFAIATSMQNATDFVSSRPQVVQRSSKSKQASRATLVLAPSTLLIDSWITEIRKHTHSGGITFHKHLGSERHDPSEIARHFESDIVFTTFATVTQDSIRKKPDLETIHYFRIVLDEAHYIRNRNTKQFQAVDRLVAQHRWCLTGTPIQNSLDDLGTLVSFLRVPILNKPPAFRTFIIAPTASKTRTRYQNLQTLLQAICLRRTKNILGLPEIVPHIQLLQLSGRERREYDDLFQRFKNFVQMAVSGRKSKVSAIVLHSIHELRLFCNNGLRTTTRDNLDSDDELFSMLQQYGASVCSKCGGQVFSIDQSTGDANSDIGTFLTTCKHLVCHSCLPQCFKPEQGCLLCASGDKPKSLFDDSVIDLYREIKSTNVVDSPVKEYPSKLLALLAALRMDPGNKCIVFSSWKKTLDLTAALLKTSGLYYEFIHGGLTLKKRINVLESFRSPTGPNILLMTLGTGAVGLNLVVATRIYILEPQWNPFIELQAMARAQRLDQTKEVKVVRYIMEDTIEHSNVLNKQKKKAALAGDGFGREKLQESLQYFGV